MSTIELKSIDGILLNSADIGVDINSRLSDINDNFETLVSQEYFKGDRGDSVLVLKSYLTNDPQQYNYSACPDANIYINNSPLTRGELYRMIKNTICNNPDEPSINIDGVLCNWYDNLGKPGFDMIYLICKDGGSIDTKLDIIGSLPFNYIDPRFSILDSNLINYNDYKHCDNKTCSITWSGDSFIANNNLPKLYYDDNIENGAFCWNINGFNTGLVAQGPQGVEGKDGVYFIIKANVNHGDLTEDICKLAIDQIVVKYANEDGQWVNGWLYYKEDDNHIPYGTPSREDDSFTVDLSSILKVGSACLVHVKEYVNGGFVYHLGFGELNDSGSDNNESKWNVMLSDHSFISPEESFVLEDVLKSVNAGSNPAGLFVPATTSGQYHIMWNSNDSFNIGLNTNYLTPDDYISDDQDAVLNIYYNNIRIGKDGELRDLDLKVGKLNIQTNNISIDCNEDGGRLLNDIIHTTRKDLIELKNNESLTPGQKYQFTHHKALPYFYQDDQGNSYFNFDAIYDATDNDYKMIITATSKNTLSDMVTIIGHENWQVWYDIDWSFKKLFTGHDDDYSCNGYTPYIEYNNEKYYISPAQALYEPPTRLVKTTLFKDGEFDDSSFIEITNYDAYGLSRKIIEIINSGGETIDCTISGSTSSYICGVESYGFIYHMIDEYYNDFPYDFKSVLFKCDENEFSDKLGFYRTIENNIKNVGNKYIYAYADKENFNIPKNIIGRSVNSTVKYNIFTGSGNVIWAKSTCSVINNTFGERNKIFTPFNWKNCNIGDNNYIKKGTMHNDTGSHESLIDRCNIGDNNYISIRSNGQFMRYETADTNKGSIIDIATTQGYESLYLTNCKIGNNNGSSDWYMTIIGGADPSNPYFQSYGSSVENYTCPKNVLTITSNNIIGDNNRGNIILFGDGNIVKNNCTHIIIQGDKNVFDKSSNIVTRGCENKFNNVNGFFITVSDIIEMGKEYRRYIQSGNTGIEGPGGTFEKDTKNIYHPYVIYTPKEFTDKSTMNIIDKADVYKTYGIVNLTEDSDIYEPYDNRDYDTILKFDINSLLHWTIPSLPSNYKESNALVKQEYDYMTGCNISNSSNLCIWANKTNIKKYWFKNLFIDGVKLRLDQRQYVSADVLCLNTNAYPLEDIGYNKETLEPIFVNISYRQPINIYGKINKIEYMDDQLPLLEDDNKYKKCVLRSGYGIEANKPVNILKMDSEYTIIYNIYDGLSPLLELPLT